MKSKYNYLPYLILFLFFFFFKGTFGQVVKCKNLDTDQFLAVKVVKNKPAYLTQGLVEVRILELVSYDT